MVLLLNHGCWSHQEKKQQFFLQEGVKFEVHSKLSVPPHFVFPWLVVEIKRFEKCTNKQGICCVWTQKNTTSVELTGKSNKKISKRVKREGEKCAFHGLLWGSCARYEFSFSERVKSLFQSTFTGKTGPPQTKTVKNTFFSFFFGTVELSFVFWYQLYFTPFFTSTFSRRKLQTMYPSFCVRDVSSCPSDVTGAW